MDIEEVKIISLIVLILAVVFGSIIGAFDVLKSHQCDNYEKVNGTRTEYVTLDSCYVESNGVMLRWDEYLARSATNE